MGRASALLAFASVGAGCDCLGYAVHLVDASGTDAAGTEGDAAEPPDDPRRPGRTLDAAPDAEAPPEPAPEDAAPEDAAPCDPVDEGPEWDDAEWNTEVPDQDGGQYTSVAVGADGVVHITYFDKEDHSLRHVWGGPGDWHQETIDDDGAGSWTSLEIDADGALHVTYSTPGVVELRYATNGSGAWTTEVLEGEGNPGAWTSLALDADGAAHVSFQFTSRGDLGYASNASGEWVLETVDWPGQTGAYSSLALDAGGGVHIAYLDQTVFAVRYATNATGAWMTQTIDDDGTLPALAIDSFGTEHLLYYSIADEEMHARRTECGLWSEEEVVAPGIPQTSTALAASPDGTVHAVFDIVDGVGRDLRGLQHYVRGSSWSRTGIGGIGKYVSVAVSADLRVSVSAWAQGPDELLYLWRDPE